MKKKLVKLAREKDCVELTSWIRSINNHLYWVAASTPNSDRQLMQEKWTSLSNHIHNQHTHKGKAFPACLHPPLDGQRKKKWLKEGKAKFKYICQKTVTTAVQIVSLSLTVLSLLVLK